MIDERNVNRVKRDLDTLLVKHENAINMKRGDCDILKYYYQIKGIVDTLAALGLLGYKERKSIENRLYKPYENK